MTPLTLLEPIKTLLKLVLDVLLDVLEMLLEVLDLPWPPRGMRRRGSLKRKSKGWPRMMDPSLVLWTSFLFFFLRIVPYWSSSYSY